MFDKILGLTTLAVVLILLLRDSRATTEVLKGLADAYATGVNALTAR